MQPDPSNASDAIGWLDIEAGLQILGLVLLLLTAIFAGSSAKAASRAAEATKRATVAEIISGLMKEYGSPEMHSYGIKILRFAHKARQDGEFPCPIPHGVEASDPDLAEVDHARRYFEQFHIRVHALHKQGLIDDDAARAIVSGYDVKVILKEHLIPMLKKDEGFENSRFRKTIPLWEKLYQVELLADDEHAC